jgi:hypothetical protein
VALWAKGAGAISKRFDGKEEPKVTAVSKQSYVLSILNTVFFPHIRLFSYIKAISFFNHPNVETDPFFRYQVQAPASSALVVPPAEALGDEAAAIQAMFQAEETQWVETQEHMAQ